MSNQTKKPPMGGMGPGKGPMTMEKAKDFKGTTNKLIKNYLSKYKISVVIVMIRHPSSLPTGTTPPAMWTC